MSEHFNQSKVEAGPESRHFTPDRATMIKRVFDATCASAQILDKPRRDVLASRLVFASKTINDEKVLADFAKKVNDGFLARSING
jgi:hypothetical protein